jgi:hypothetical protein
MEGTSLWASCTGGFARGSHSSGMPHGPSVGADCGMSPITITRCRFRVFVGAPSVALGPSW